MNACHERVLWIDDQVGEDDPTARFLRLSGFEVHCASSGARGLSMACSSPYARVILDLALPDIPGLTVLARLRAQGIGTPVLVLTGFGDYDSALTAGALGVGAFRSKPIDADDLVDALRRLEPALAGTHDGVGARSRGQVVGALLIDLEALAHPQRLDEQRHVESGTLVTSLLRAISEPALPLPVFLACAEGLRLTGFLRQPSSSSDLLSAVHGLVACAIRMA